MAVGNSSGQWWEPPRPNDHLRRAPAATSLERPVDRAEARLRRSLVIAVIAVVPIALWFSLITKADQERTAAEIARSVHTVDAHTTADAPGFPASASDTVSSPTVAASWTYRGVVHTGQAIVAPASPAGTTVALSVDDRGNPTRPPATESDVLVLVIAAFLVTILVAAGVAAFAMWAAGRRFDAVRERMWDDALMRLLS